MSSLLDCVRRLNLTVTAHTPGSVLVSEGVREGDGVRFELDLLDWDGGTVRAWRGSNPERLLADGLGLAALNEPGAGFFKMCLHDRFGGIPRGESVTFTTASPDYELSQILLEGDSPPDEFAEALFGAAPSPEDDDEN